MQYIVLYAQLKFIGYKGELVCVNIIYKVAIYTKITVLHKYKYIKITNKYCSKFKFIYNIPNRFYTK